ncbi:M23 family metallopeptidase [Sporolactobacillus shoreicorticis]|uniref:Peptidoglycan DD-metalloendopeptidase family protein n=1 Tax=Sporolactobacillus shoreicorticis TaxID=1923877 RepID=A0ABW5RYB0_9BACL|nr:M23 family metallopeptidase [Sporolactobacillus shoreicorticis]MCO7127951.1 M23 family metallopeptidase [Sporolactobacillus shoreicorticis]
MKDFMDYKRRHEQRKQRKLMMMQAAPKPYMEYKHGSGRRNDAASYYEPFDEQNQTPVHHTRRFLFQCVISALLVGSVYGINNHQGSQFQAVKGSIKTAMTQEFQFAAVSDWYEKNLGDPISFLPNFKSDSVKTANGGSTGTDEVSKTSSFAEPVVGEVKSPYSSQSKGVTVETTSHSEVKAAKDGLVVFVGKKKNIGETVVIQHKDSDESWYGKLDKANVKVYQEVKKGQKIGITSEKNKKGTFYFALKKGEKFIDPIQVMSFD